jgi:hypothetical protein
MRLQPSTNFIGLSTVSTHFLRVLVLSRVESAEIFSYSSKPFTCVEAAHTKTIVLMSEILVSIIFSVCSSEIHTVTTEQTSPTNSVSANRRVALLRSINNPKGNDYRLTLFKKKKIGYGYTYNVTLWLVHVTIVTMEKKHGVPFALFTKLCRSQQQIKYLKCCHGNATVCSYLLLRYAYVYRC